MVDIRAIIISVLGSSQSGETQTLKETDNFLMTRPGSDAEFHQVAVSEFPASLNPTNALRSYLLRRWDRQQML